MVIGSCACGNVSGKLQFVQKWGGGWQCRNLFVVKFVVFFASVLPLYGGCCFV